MFMRGWSPQGSVPNSLVGTPATSVDKKSEPPPTDEEMKARIQYMINLQEAAQKQGYPVNVTDEEPEMPPPIAPDSVAGAYITPAAAAEAAAASAAVTRRPAAMIAPAEKPPAVPRPPSKAPPTAPPKGRSIMGSVPYQQDFATSVFAREAATIDGVGHGHMYFPGEYSKQQSSEEQHPILDGTVPQYYGGGPMVGHTAIDDSAAIDDPDYVEKPHSHRHHHSRHCCGCLARCFKNWKNAEALHRSFCYGAIDGMLTGSGIVAAFLGMGLLTASASVGMHLFVVAFSLAACTSDAICMALGHIWSTHVLTNASANERRTERLSFERNRADAKGKLVDMLLSRGMLKIDAMSIADTLEGYPDIFVSALVGDSGYTLGEESLPSSGSSSGQLGGLGFGQEETNFSPLLRARRTYGQFREELLDPEAAGVKVALGESRKEGLVMMLSFAIFSVLPSLILLWLSTVMNVTTKQRASGGTSATSIAVSLTSVIMLLLGTWKSRFFDSNWIIFGIETVVVLWICTLSAYFIGFGLSMCLPGLHGISPIEDNGL